MCTYYEYPEWFQINMMKDLISCCIFIEAWNKTTFKLENQMSVNVILVPDCVFVPTWWACSLISSFKDVAATLILIHLYFGTQQYSSYSKKSSSSDTISQFSHESVTSTDSKEPVYIAAGDIRRRLAESLTTPSTTFKVTTKFLQDFMWQLNTCNSL